MGLVLAQAEFCGPPSSLLMAFVEDHTAPFAASPRHTRQVPITIFEVSAGSSSQGVSIRESSSATCAAPIVGGPVKFAAVQPLPSLHCRTLTPAAVETYQSSGLFGSIATAPPSPGESCGHTVVREEAADVAAVPFAPRPTSKVAGSVGCCAKLTTSASEPMPLFRFWKCDASLAEQGVPCWLTPSVERHRPPSLPR